MRRWVTLGAVLVIGCAERTPRPLPVAPEGVEEAAPIEPTPIMHARKPAPPAPAPAPPPGFAIVFDYRFANGWFDDPLRRQALEHAAGLWTAVIREDWTPYPAGSTFQVPDYVHDDLQTVTLDREVKGYVVFVITVPKLSKGLKAEGGLRGKWAPAERFRRGTIGSRAPTYVGYLAIGTEPGRPWFFDATPDTTWDMPVQTGHDFETTIAHELGHALGMLHLAYKARGFQHGDTFTGPHAMALFGGKPVPLAFESAHLHRDANVILPRPALDRHLMGDGSSVQGLRVVPSELDLAMLADLGWNVDASARRLLDDAPRAHHPLAGKALSGPHASGLRGLWDFTRPEYLYEPVVGRPWKLIPARDERARTGPPEVRDGGLRLLPDAWFLVDHGIAAQAPNRCVNQYSLAWTVRIPSVGVAYPLFSTTKGNSSVPAATIDAAGRFAGGSPALQPGRWYSLVVAVDVVGGTITFYQDGVKTSSRAAKAVDGADALCDEGMFAMFAGRGVPAQPMDVGRVALWDRALGPADASALRLAAP